MTTTLPFDAETVDLTAAAVEIAAHLPAEHGLAPRLGGTGAWIPAGASRAVVVEIGDTGAHVALIVSELVAGALQFGQEGTIPLEAALAPALSAAVSTLGVPATALRPPHEADPAIFAHEAAGVALDDGPNHAASLVIAMPRVAPADTAPQVAPADTAPQVAPAAMFDAVDGADERRAAAMHRPIEFLSDVELAVTAELGRTRMTVRELLGLGPGSIVELDRVAGSHVDLLVNGRLIARGEVVVVDDEFGVRVSEVVARERGIADAATRHG